VDAAGLRLRVGRHGSGQPVILITGIGAHLDMWAPFARQAGERELIGIRPAQCWATAASPAADARPRSRDCRVAGRPRAGALDVLGYSFGGALAQELAYRAPERVRRWWCAPRDVLGDVRVRVDGGDKPVFVGIVSDDDVDRYLGHVDRDELIEFDGDNPQFDLHEGGAPRAPAGEQDFLGRRGGGLWRARGHLGCRVRSLDRGRDECRHRGIDVEADAGVKLGWAIWAGLGMFLVGLLMSAGAVVVILLIGRRAGRDSTTG
jgi:pimeloyl-ACP methyl ester carboxylesterase